MEDLNILFCVETFISTCSHVTVYPCHAEIIKIYIYNFVVSLLTTTNKQQQRSENHNSVLTARPKTLRQGEHTP